ncbi:MAG: biotin-dependent carboxyltransferase family protein [Burkholderiaceae bacterium]
MIEVLRAGPMTSVQDGGRSGWRALGVTAAGALDTTSLSLANLLVGNRRDAAALEISLAPVRLRFDRPARIALAGAGLDGRLDDGAPIRCWWSYRIEAGRTLTLNPIRPLGDVGLHTYLAVSGGIEVPEVLGSRSTDLKSGFGGLQGRLLVDGDRLPVGTGGLAQAPDARDRDGVPLGRPFGVRAPEWFWPKAAAGGRSPAVPVRFVPGPEWEDFSLVSRRLLVQEDWEVSARSNRIGYRLGGPTLVRLKARSRDLLSHGVLPGVIQVPPDGQPIVLMADAQTTGGYPKIGVVVSADLPVVAQVRFGARLRFVECDLAQARAALRLAYSYLDEMAGIIDSRLGREPGSSRRAAPGPAAADPALAPAAAAPIDNGDSS